MITLNDIEIAYEQITSMINKTNVLTSRTLYKMVGANIFVKSEK